VIKISGAVAKSFALPLAELATLPRRELTADFHCAAGWSATDLHWRRSTPEFVVLGAGSRLGLAAELLFKRQQRTLLFATFLQQKNQIAQAVWAGIARASTGGAMPPRAGQRLGTAPGSAMNPATANARSTRSGPPDALDLGPRPGYGRRVNQGGEPLPSSTADSELKARHRSMWESGDYPSMVETFLLPLGEACRGVRDRVGHARA